MSPQQRPRWDLTADPYQVHDRAQQDPSFAQPFAPYSPKQACRSPHCREEIAKLQMVIESLKQDLEEARLTAEEQEAVIAGYRWEVEEQEIERQEVICQRDAAERRAAAALDTLQALTAQPSSDMRAQSSSSSDKLVLDSLEETQLEELQIEEHQKRGSSAGQSSLAVSTAIDPSSRSLPPTTRSMPPAARKQAVALIAEGAEHQNLAASEAKRIFEDQLARFDGGGGAMEAASAHYKRFGGAQVEALLCDYDLVDARYLVALGEANGVVLPWRDVPDCARINQQTAWRLRAWNKPFSLPVLVLSYPWLDKVRSIGAHLPASDRSMADGLQPFFFSAGPFLVHSFRRRIQTELERRCGASCPFSGRWWPKRRGTPRTRPWASCGTSCRARRASEPRRSKSDLRAA